MTTDELFNALGDHGTHIMLDETGCSLRVRGGRPSSGLLAEVKAHKLELVAALQEARDLARDLVREGDVEAFAAEFSAATRRGTLSITDRYAAGLALTLARRWQGAAEENAA